MGVKLTEDEKAKLETWSRKWVAIGLRSGRQTDDERRRTVVAMKRMYEVSGLSAPEVRFCASPLDACLRCGFHFAAAVGSKPPHDLELVRRDAQKLDNWYVDPYDLRRSAEAFGVPSNGIACARRAMSECRQGGNQWASISQRISFYRHNVPAVAAQVDYSKWQYWEELSEISSCRFLLSDVVWVSEFPDSLKVDPEGRAHCEDGPYAEWGDGLRYYAWHGTNVPARWIEQKADVSPAEVLRHENSETRRAGCEIIGWDRILERMGTRVIDEDEPSIGTLLECDMPDAPGSRFLRARCGTGRTIVLPVQNTHGTAIEASMWTYDVMGKISESDWRVASRNRT